MGKSLIIDQHLGHISLDAIAPVHRFAQIDPDIIAVANVRHRIPTLDFMLRRIFFDDWALMKNRLVDFIGPGTLVIVSIMGC